MENNGIQFFFLKINASTFRNNYKEMASNTLIKHDILKHLENILILVTDQIIST